MAWLFAAESRANLLKLSLGDKNVLAMVAILTKKCMSTWGTFISNLTTTLRHCAGIFVMWS